MNHYSFPEIIICIQSSRLKESWDCISHTPIKYFIYYTKFHSKIKNKRRKKKKKEKEEIKIKNKNEQKKKQQKIKKGKIKNKKGKISNNIKEKR